MRVKAAAVAHVGLWDMFFGSSAGGRVVINASGELNSLGWLTVVRDSRVGGSCLPAFYVSRVAVGSWNLL